MAEDKRMGEAIQPWDSDHTALVHVLWAVQREGNLSRHTDCDLLASRIMQSKWMRAVRLHAAEKNLSEALDSPE
jgi:hypothetical protein